MLRRRLFAPQPPPHRHSREGGSLPGPKVVGWRELVDVGGYSEARHRGLIRTEGRDYVVRDGDVITIRH